jgi:hypothetical protein
MFKMSVVHRNNQSERMQLQANCRLRKENTLCIEDKVSNDALINNFGILSSNVIEGILFVRYV